MKISVNFELEVNLKDYGFDIKEMNEEIIKSLEREFGTDLRSTEVKAE